MKSMVKSALITGAGRGIGAAIAEELQQAGYHVILVARTRTQIEELAEKLGGTAIVCDVSDPAQIKNLPAADILVNNAGLATSAPLHKLQLEDWNHLLTVNLTGTMLCTQVLLPHMLKAGWGRVINIASVAGLTGARYLSAYAASKHAVVGFTRALADEVASKGVTVNAICPGFVDTPLVQQSLINISLTTGRTPEQALQALTSQNPQQRLIQSEEVAFAVRFLCDEKARGINGQCLVIDGGALRA